MVSGKQNKKKSDIKIENNELFYGRKNWNQQPEKRRNFLIFNRRQNEKGNSNMITFVDFESEDFPSLSLAFIFFFFFLFLERKGFSRIQRVSLGRRSLLRNMAVISTAQTHERPSRERALVMMMIQSVLVLVVLVVFLVLFGIAWGWPATAQADADRLFRLHDIR